MKTMALIFILFYGVLHAQEAPKRDWLYHSIEITYIGFHTLDYITTLKGLSMGAKEVNPFFKPIVGKPLLFTMVKLTTVIPLLLLRGIKEYSPRLAKWALVGLNIIVGIVIYNNFKVVGNMQ